MKSIYSDNLKATLNTFLLKIHLLPIVSALRVSKRIEIDMGHLKSVDGWMSIDGNKKPVPWITYPAIDYLKSLELKKFRVFEYGSGNSTLFWTAKAKNVISIEHDLNWFNLIKNKIIKNNNAKLYFSNKKNYGSQITKTKGKFDIIFIDGIKRDECARWAVKKLSNRGLIILDNSERYNHICRELRKHDLVQIDFTGFGPINPYTWSTSIFLTKQFRPKFNQKKI